MPPLYLPSLHRPNTAFDIIPAQIYRLQKIFQSADTPSSLEWFSHIAVSGLSLIGSLFIFAIGTGVAAIIILFIIDITQTKSAVRRNYPVIGRFRTLFTHMGEFFRQYFFALDREEMPFNRAERDWINHVCDEGKEMVPFGSTKVLTPGTPIFANCMFPKLEEEERTETPLVIGPNTKHPYHPQSLFNISGLSYGALSRPAIQALSNGARLAGCYLNTGEGGVSPFHLEGECDIIYQLGTAKFGARNEDHTLNAEKLKKVCANPYVKMVEIKLSQGAKPGKGGILPAQKVSAEIAEIRGIPEGEAAISPNRHVDASTPEELIDLIHRVREASGLPTGIKVCVGNVRPFITFLKAIKARGDDSAPDFITVDGGDGGTGAAPLPLIDNTGLTIREALPLVDDLLQEFGLRERITLIASGKLITSADIAWAFCAGADMVNGGRGFMFALGCIQALKCDRNTCPTGITTHNARLQRGLDPTNKAVRVANYVKAVQSEIDIIAHACGVDHPRQLRREHLMIVRPTGRSSPFSTVWEKSRYI